MAQQVQVLAAKLNPQDSQGTRKINYYEPSSDLKAMVYTHTSTHAQPSPHLKHEWLNFITLVSLLFLLLTTLNYVTPTLPTFQYVISYFLIK